MGFAPAIHFVQQAVLPSIKDFGTFRLAAAFVVSTLASVLLYRNIFKLLWPGSRADPSFQEPLPPGSLGCPLLGVNLIAGSKRFGPEYGIRKASKRAKDARIWKSYFMGRSVALFSGAELVKKINDMEFVWTDARSAGAVKRQKKEGYKEKPAVFGKNNLMFERDKKKHSFLRRLVGAAMTPHALKGALPTIQRTATDVIDREVLRSSKEEVKMEDVCVDYTLDIVQKQLLGLDLHMEEVIVFRNKVKVWLQAMYSLVNQLNIAWLVKRSPPFKAKQYIVSKLEEKVDERTAPKALFY